MNKKILIIFIVLFIAFASSKPSPLYDDTERINVYSNINLFTQNVTDLCDLNDTVCTALSNNDLLTWDSSLQRWRNKQPIFFRWLTNSFYLFNDSTTIYFNETKLNNTIDARDTQKNTTGFYLYNDSTTIYFNETQLNATIGSISVSEDEIIFLNNSNQIYLKPNYPNYFNFSDKFFVNGTSGYVGIGESSPEARLHIMDGIIQEYNSTPKVSGNISNSTIIDYAFGLSVHGKYAYVTGRNSDSLAIIDVSNASSPTITGYIQNSTIIDSPYGVFVSDKYAYVTGSDSDSLAIIDISNSTSPTITGYIQNSTILDSPYDVYVSGRYAYVTAGGTSDSLVIIDISNSSSPQITGYVSSSTYMDGAFHLYVYGKYAYVTGSDSDSLAIIDISNASSPTITGYYIDSFRMDLARGIFVSGRYAYVTGQNTDSIVVLDVSNPSSPQFVSYFVGSTIMYDPIGNIYVYGKYAYLTGSNSDTFTILDISNPYNVKYINSVNHPSMDEPTNVFISGRYAYVTAVNSDALVVIDILGTELTNVDAVNIRTGSLDVDNFAFFGGGIDVSNGISSSNILVRNGASIGGIFNVENQKVGIGTTSPSVELDVVGDINAKDTITIYDSDSGFARFISSDRLYFTGGKAFDFGNSIAVAKQIIAVGTDGLKIQDRIQRFGIFINDTGKVAIGHDSPTAWLDVKSSDENSSGLRVRNGTKPTIPNIGDLWIDDMGAAITIPSSFGQTRVRRFAVEDINYIESLDDLPAPDVNGYIHLNSELYYIARVITLVGPTYKGFYIENGSSATITGPKTIQYVNQNATEDALFYSDDIGGDITILNQLNVVSDGSGRLFKINSSNKDGFILLTSFSAGGFYDLGTIEDISYFGFIVNLVQNVADGFKFINNTAIGVQSHRFYDWYNAGATFVSIYGDIGSIQVNNCFFRPESNEFALLIDDNMTTSGGSVVGNAFDLTQNGSIFEDGKGKEDVYWTYAGNTNLADSTATASSYFLGNAITTSIPALNTYYLINTTWINETAERFTFLTNGTFVYTGLEDIKLNIQLNVDIDPAVSNTNWRVAVFKNGQIINNTIDPISSPGTLTKSATFGSTTTHTGDYFDARISRTSSSGDVDVVNGKLSLSRV